MKTLAIYRPKKITAPIVKPQKSTIKNQLMALPAIMVTLGLCVIFGLSQVTSKVALGEFTPFFFGALAAPVSALALWVYCQINSVELRPKSWTIFRLHCLSALLFVLFHLTYFLGLQFTLASRASVFLACHPFFVVILNSLWLKKEHLNFGKNLGIFVAFTGMTMVFGYRLDGNIQLTWFGDMLTLVTSLGLALTILHIRQVTQYVSSIQASFWQIFLSIPLYWLAAITVESPFSLPQLPQSWFGFIYYAIVISMIAYVVRAELFRRYSANTISSFLLLVPIFGVIVGNLVLGDPLTFGLILGGLLVCLGILIIYQATYVSQSPVTK